MKPEENRPQQSIKIEIQQPGRGFGSGSGFGRGPGMGSFQGMSMEKMQAMRDKYMSMSDQEREKFRSERGGGFGGGPGGGRPGGGSGGRPRR
jgi:hypothetical protein